ncbi:prepilin peptidase [uncultured Gimesia sp.]|uniref:prepilin peptidase n=1 Tax=uncultured Gimesia sp. TaxID=1678688 RepID=UPI0030D76B1A|tara:strand:- start:327287 stop:327760 length:474 start_codon:yes stop_codon:yes gene_type:complete
MFDVPVYALSVICSLTVLLCVSIWFELRTRRIPNWLTLAGVITGFVISAIDQQWSLHLSGFFLGAVIGVFAWGKGFASAGFVKLLIALSTIMGPVVALVSLILGGLLTICGYLYHKFKVPPELEYEEEQTSDGLVKGSLFLLVVTLFGLLLLYQPWN